MTDPDGLDAEKAAQRKLGFTMMRLAALGIGCGAVGWGVALVLAFVLAAVWP